MTTRKNIALYLLGGFAASATIYLLVRLANWRVNGMVLSLSVYALVWTYFWRSNRGLCYYFDAQDFVKYEGGADRELPKSAETGTFEPLLQHYIGVSKLLITLAAASITFGAGQTTKSGIWTAKLILAFSILYGVLFCAFVLYIYDEYRQNVRAYTRFWYSTVETFGFSCLICFILGYVVWALTI